MTVECRRCLKAIRIEEWQDHLDWHLAADREPDPPDPED